MTLHDCSLYAFEGAPGVGKTTTALATVAKLKAAGSSIGYCDESGRNNLLVEDYTLHGASLSINTELHLLTSSIADQILASRLCGSLVCDKSPFSVLAYLSVLLGDTLKPTERRLAQSMIALTHAWSYSYDLIFVLQDRYGSNNSDDPVRAKVAHLQDDVERAILSELNSSGVRYMLVPTDLSLDDRVDWIVAEMLG